MKFNGDYVKLGSLTTKIGSGATPRGGKESYHKNGIALIRSQNIYNDGFISQGLAFIDEEQARQLNNVTLKNGDVLLNITGDSVARVCQVPEEILPARVNQHVAIIRPQQGKLDGQFLRYLLTSPKMQEFMLQLASAGATRNALTKGMIENIEVPNIPYTEQEKIGNILGSLDNKINLNNQTNQILEEMANAIFKSWFVNFEPVRANAEGRNTGLPIEIVNLFTDSFETSQLEEIPQGWKVQSLLDYANLLSGGTPKTNVPEYWDGDIFWVSAKDVSHTQGLYILDTEKKITTLGVKKSNAKILPKNTVVVTARGTVGSYTLLGKPMAINQTNYGLTGKTPNEEYFLFFSLVHLLRELKQNAYGTIFDTITTSTFRNAMTLIPPTSLIRCFNDLVAPFMEKILENTIESNTLRSIRDELLPKLMSGELNNHEND